MEDMDQKKAGTGRQKKARQWAEKRIINLDREEKYDRDLSELTGSGCQGDFNKIRKLDHYSQAKMAEMMFQETEKRMDINSLLGIKEYSGLLLAGPAGCGKMTTAEHLVGNLKKRGYTRLAVLTGSHFGARSMKKAAKRMKALLSFAEEDQPMALILEQLSENQYAEELCGLLLDFARALETGALFPILIERDANAFSSALRRNFPLIMFDLPSREERKNYIRLHQNAEVLFEEDSTGEPDGETNVLSYKIVFDGITPDEIAAETEGFSYAQLKYLIEYMKLYMADTIVRDNVENDYAYKCLQEEGHYTVKGHMVRQGIRMLSYAKESLPYRAALDTPITRQSASQQAMAWRNQQNQQNWRGQDTADTPGQDIRLPLSEIEKKVKAAAEGGPKDYRALAERYRKPVYDAEEFGAVDERLANMSDEYDAEE